MDDHPSLVQCATYTHARRHPMVIGQIGGWTPPFQLSLPQVVVLVVGYLIEAWTYRWWGGVLPQTVAVIGAVGLPCLLAWAVRSARIEGRSLPRAAAGYLAYAAMPRTGTVGGRPYRPARPADLRWSRVYVSGGGETA
jgi:hypothetical protein